MNVFEDSGMFFCSSFFDKVNQRIGRLKQKYPSVHEMYNIEIEKDEKDEKDVCLSMKGSRIAEKSATIDKDEKLSIRCCSQPTGKARKIYTALKMKEAPFVRKKSPDFDNATPYSAFQKSWSNNLRID